MPAGSDEDPTSWEVEESEDWSLSAVLRGVLNSVYHLFYLACPDFDEENHSQSQRLAQTFYAGAKAIIALQLISFLYPAKPFISEWDRYSLWTSVISFVRVDFLLVKMNLGHVMFYACAGLVAVPIGLYVSLYRTLKRQKPRKWRLRVFLFRLALRTMSGVLYLPILSIFLASQKYLGSSAMFEYEDAAADSLAPPGVRIVSGVLAAAVLVESALSNLLMYDIFAIHSSQVIDARVHSRVEVFSLASQTACAVSHFVLHEGSPLLHYLLCLAVSSASAAAYIYFLPFYGLFPVIVNILAFALVSTSAVAMAVGSVLGNATSGFLLTILVPFVLPPLIWDVLQRRKMFIATTYIHNFVNLGTAYQCELCIRLTTFAFQAKHPTSAMKAWKEFYLSTLSPLFNRLTSRFSGSMSPALWEFAYIFSILKDESLARIKLSKTANCCFDFEGGFNRYRFMRVLEKSAGISNEEVDYVNFRLMYDKAKKADEESCLYQFDFWTSLSVDHPSVRKVENLARKINVSIARARKQFSKLIQSYPKSHLALKLYGSYLNDVLNDTEKGRDLINRSLFEEHELQSKSLQQENRFSYFDDSNGIMLISGSADSVGTLLFVNEEVSSILGAASKLVIGMNIATFLPKTVISQPAHDAAMKRFLLFSTSNDVGVPFNLFLIDMSGFMIEVHIQVRCMALELRQFFIVALKRNTAQREACLFDEEWTIKTHTKGFACLIGYSDSAGLFLNLHAEVLVRNFCELKERHSQNEVFMYVIPGTVNEVAMKFADLQFRGRLFHLLYCTSDADEVEKWKVAKPQAEAGNFDDLLHGETLNPGDLSSTLMYCKSSIKSILRDPNAPRKNLTVCLDIVPTVFELPETDFRPGKRIIGKMKDAAPIDPREMGKSITFNQEELEEKAEEVEICDLKDLDEFVQDDHPQELPADQQSRISVAILSELGQVSEPGRKQGGKSIASSAVSSNSSFTSSATAIMLLKVVQTSMTRFKCSFLITNVVVICVVVAMVVYLSVASVSYEDVLLIEDLAHQRSLCAVMASLAQDLLLIQARLLPADDEDLIRTRLQTNLVEFNSILDVLMNHVEDFSSETYRRIYLENVIPTWEMSAGTIVFDEDNLLDILRKMSTYAAGLLASSLKDINSTSPGIFYLYRNGQGEVLKAVNASAWEFISGEQETFKYTLNVIGGLGILAFLLMLSCFVAVLLPTVVQVDRSNQNVWTFFYKLPLDIVQDLKFRCEDRIETTHGIEMERKESELTHFKSMKSRLHLRSSRKWPYIFSRIWVYYLITIAYAIYFYFDVYQGLGSTLLRKPEVMNLIGERDLEVQSAYHWLQETVIRNTSFSYFALQRDSQLFPSPLSRLDSILSHLKDLEDTLVSSKQKGAGRTANATAVLFDSACIDSDTLCTDSLMARGVHSALLGFLIDVKFVAMGESKIDSKDVRSLKSVSSYLHSQLLELLSSTQAQLSSDINNVRLRVQLLTVTYCAICVLFYIFVYLPMASLVRKQLTDIWDLASLIPIDLLERIKRAMRVSGPGISNKK